MTDEVPIVAARWVEIDEGDVLMVWVRLDEDELEVEIDFEFDDPFDDLDDDDLGFDFNF